MQLGTPRTYTSFLHSSDVGRGEIQVTLQMICIVSCAGLTKQGKRKENKEEVHM
jgi:hypothetical protein